VIGRLAPGVSFHEARVEMDGLGVRLQQRYPQTNAGRTIRVVALTEGILDDVSPRFLLITVAAVGFILLIVCANVGSLLLARAAGRLRQLVGEHSYGEDGADLAAVVLEALRKERHRLGVAESCTGGMVAERITNIPGASDTFIGGVVAYADVIKTAALKVPLELLEAYGAVSDEVVRAMAEGAQRLFSADATIAVTGIAGPGGGTPEKPVGTVWLAARVHTNTRAVKRVFPGDRDEIRRRSAQAALDLLRRMLAAP